MKLLTVLVEDYDRRYAFPQHHGTPAERLRCVLEVSGKTPAALIAILPAVCVGRAGSPDSFAARGSGCARNLVSKLLIAAPQKFVTKRLKSICSSREIGLLSIWERSSGGQLSSAFAPLICTRCGDYSLASGQPGSGAAMVQLTFIRALIAGGRLND